MIKDPTGRILAWALVFNPHHISQKSAYFYTRKCCRRQGLGLRLARQIHARYNKVAVYGWDSGSNNFFNVCREEFAIKGWHI